MGLADELTRRFKEVQRTTQEFIQIVNSLEGKYDSKESEIKTLEGRIEKLRDQADEISRKNTAMLSEASDEAAKIRNEANRFYEEVNNSKLTLKSDQEVAKKLLNEANALMANAKERQKEADNEYRKNQETRERLLKAVQS